MGKIYQFINSLGRATTTSNSYNRVHVNNTNRLHRMSMVNSIPTMNGRWFAHLFKFMFPVIVKS